MLKNSKAQHIGDVVPYELVDALKAGEKPDTLTFLKLLIVIVEQFQLNKFFYCNPIVHVPYCFNQEHTLRLNFSPDSLCFEIFTRHDLTFGGFASVKMNIDFYCILDQMVVFEKDIIWENLEFDVPFTKPPVHHFVSFVIHNLSNGDLLVPANALLGKLKIYSLSKHVI